MMPTEMPPIRAIVFDMGNTLWFEARSPDVDLLRRTEADRVQPLLDDWRMTLPIPAGDMVREIWAAEERAFQVEATRGTLRESDIPASIVSAFRARGIDLPLERAAAWWRAAWLPSSMFGMQLYPDALDVLRELKSASVLVGVATNRPCTAEMFAPALDEYGLARFVDAIVCSGDTGYIKPHRSVFAAIVARLDVAAEEAVMVGDSAAVDMAGAKAAGMHTVWKLNGRYDPPPCAEADYVIHDLAQLLTLPLLPQHRRHPVTIDSLTPHEDGNAGRY